jgi:hypothetical protein
MEKEKEKEEGEGNSSQAEKKERDMDIKYNVMDHIQRFQSGNMTHHQLPTAHRTQPNPTNLAHRWRKRVQRGQGAWRRESIE